MRILTKLTPRSHGALFFKVRVVHRLPFFCKKICNSLSKLQSRSATPCRKEVGRPIPARYEPLEGPLPERPGFSRLAFTASTARSGLPNELPKQKTWRLPSPCFYSYSLSACFPFLLFRLNSLSNGSKQNSTTAQKANTTPNVI